MTLITRKKVLLIENSSIDFYNSRLLFAKHLINLGCEVYALLPSDHYCNEIESEGIIIIKYKFDRNNKGILQLVKLVFFYNSIIKKYKFDIIHSFRFQPNIISALSNYFNSKKIILHITGLGIAFSNNSFKYKALKITTKFLYLIIIFRANIVILQNEEDKNELLFNKFWGYKLNVILGSGVNTVKFNKVNFNKEQLRSISNFNMDDKIFIIVTRLIWEKGIRELVNAFEYLHTYHKDIKLLIVGSPDFDNPRSITQEFINTFKVNSCIKFLGERNDIPELLSLSDCFIFPSYYREGVPRSILEALAMSLPIITTNMPGCNITVIDSYNGFLIEPRSSGSIINAVRKIYLNSNFNNFGECSRALAENNFANNVIFNKISKYYL